MSRDGKSSRLDLLVSRLSDAPRGPRRARLRSALEAVARAYGTEEQMRLDVVWSGDVHMRRLNKRHTGRGDSTDVLAFEEDLIDPESGCRRLGEIVCNLELARRSARANGNTPEAEAVLYASHGLAHLLGGDDHTPGGRESMRRIEIAALEAAGLAVRGGEWESASNRIGGIN